MIRSEEGYRGSSRAGAEEITRRSPQRSSFRRRPWGSHAQDRGRVLFRPREKLPERSALAELESRTRAKHIAKPEYDISDVATCFEYIRRPCHKKLSAMVNPVPDNAMSLTLKEPVGVAGQIIPEHSAADGGVEAGACAPRRLYHAS